MASAMLWLTMSYDAPPEPQVAADFRLWGRTCVMSLLLDMASSSIEMTIQPLTLQRMRTLARKANLNHAWTADAALCLRSEMIAHSPAISPASDFLYWHFSDLVLMVGDI